MYVCLSVCPSVCLSGYAFQNAWTDFDETLRGRSCGHGTLHNTLDFLFRVAKHFLMLYSATVSPIWMKFWVVNTRAIGRLMMGLNF